ncbi:methyl-accepting chemotaxis protein [Phaeospirillum tilakii]|uniref:Methyl-accepting chemotaxis protein n=1 Tax=Phaeospirillum tilakii TaxID=741673 RepID=A0ABW5CDH0_9PROT
MSIKTFISACLGAIAAFMGLIALFLFSQNWKDYQSARDAGTLVGLLGASTRVTEGLAIERGATNVVLEGNAAGRAALDQVRGRLDASFEAATAQAKGAGVAEGAEVLKTLETIRATLRTWRDKADAFTPATPEQGVAMRQEFGKAVYEAMNLALKSNAMLERHLVKLDAEVANPAMLAGESWNLRDLSSRDSTSYIVALTASKPIDAALLREMTLSDGRIRQTWERLAERAGAADSPAALREAVAKVEASYITPMKALRQRVISAGTTGAGYDLDAAEWRRLTGPMMQSTLAIRDAALEEAARVADTNRGEALNTLRLLGLLLAAATATLAGSVIAIQRRVVTPLSDLTGTIAAFAAGQRSFSVPHAGRADEIGQMAQAIEVLRANACDADDHARQEAAAAAARDQRRSQVEAVTARFVTSIDKVVDGVSVAIEGLRRATATLSATSATTTEQSGVVANAADHASSNVQTVAAAAEELSNSIQEISRRVAETAHAMDGAVRQAEATDATVRGLAEAARRIGDVVSLITDIASQTNLLALNATIEAARAGEAGKGFAVVAGEVKSLANQTARATDDIQTQVAAIQAETQRAVEAIGGISATIATVNQYTIGIASAVEQQGAATQEIARNVQQAAAGTAEVSHSIERVLEAERATATAATELSALADRLHGESDRLKGEVGGFVAEVKAG